MRGMRFPAIMFVFMIVLFGLAGCSGTPAGNNPSSSANGGTALSEPTQSASSASEENNKTDETATPAETAAAEQKEDKNMATPLYQGHGSLRVTTGEGKVIYIDLYAGEGYDAPADLILVTHTHQDHTAIDKIKTQNPRLQNDHL